MVGWIILGVFMLLIVAFNGIPLALTLAWEEETFFWQIRVAGRALRLGAKDKSEAPAEEKPAETNPPEEKKKKQKAKKSGHGALGLSPAELLELLRRVLRKLRLLPGKICVKLFRLHFLAAGDDPYNTAMLYGYANAGLSLLTAAGKRSFRVFKTDIQTAVDFAEEKMRVEARLEASIRVGQLVWLGLAAFFSALQVLLRSRRRRKKEQRAAQKETRKMLMEEATQAKPPEADEPLNTTEAAAAEERT